MDKVELLRLLAEDPEIRAAVAAIVVDAMRTGRLGAGVAEQMPRERRPGPAWLARTGPAGDTA